MNNVQAPVIIKKVIEEGGHGHHGGAWKVAYADFVTAMMAFFLMLWLLSTADEQTLKGLAEHFSAAEENKPGTEGGVGGILDGTSVMSEQLVINSPMSPFSTMSTPPMTEAQDEDPFELDFTQDDFDSFAMDQQDLEDAIEQIAQQQFEETKAEIEQTLAETPELANYVDNLVIDRTPQGLRIQLIDQHNKPMFAAGRAEMFGHTEKLIGVVAKAISKFPHRLSIRGHTDSTPFSSNVDYDNWRLSSDRANSTRSALINAGIDQKRIAEVIGKADAEHLFEERPNDPRNRRVSLVLLDEKRIELPFEP